MRNSQPKILSDIINTQLYKKKSTLNTIYSHKMIINKLNKLLLTFLPIELQSQCKIINYRQNILIIATKSASWQIRLRYEQENLLSSFRQNGLCALSSIKLIVDPTMQTND